MKQKSHQSAYATKIKKLVETAKQLRTENFRLALPITRLTSFNCLCQDEVAAEQFALYMSKLVQQQINDADCAIWCQYYFGQNLSQKFPNLIYST